MPKAIMCRELGSPDKLRVEEVPSVPLKAGQVRIAVRAAGLNFPDILMAAGEYQLKPELPFIPGMEGAGDITEIAPDVTGVKVGDRVIFGVRFGAFSEEVVCAVAQLTPLPSTFDYAQGATYLVAHGTAYHALVDRAQLQAGETLLVHGAGGGVGLAAVEIGKLLGAKVIAAASSQEKLEVAKARGADHGVLYSAEPFREAVKRLTDGRGVDVVFDPIGGDFFEQSLRCIAWGARLCVIGFTGGVGVAKTNLVLIKGASVLGVRAGEAVRQKPSLGIGRARDLKAWAEEKKVSPNISARLPLAEVAKGMQLLSDRKAIGRVVLLT